MKHQNGGLKVPLFDLWGGNVMFRCHISLVPSNQLIVPSTLLAPTTHIQTDKNRQSHKATKPQRYISLDHWHISSMTEKELYWEDQNMRRHTFMITKKIGIRIICCAFHLVFSKGYFYSRSFQKYSRTSVENSRIIWGFFKDTMLFQGLFKAHANHLKWVWQYVCWLRIRIC